MPTLLLVFALAGAVVAVVVAAPADGWRVGPDGPASRWSGSRRSRCRWRPSCWAPTSTTGCASCCSRPGARVLAAFGMAWAIERAESTSFRSLVPIVGVAALALPVADQVTMQPYQTSYVNLATDLSRPPPGRRRPSRRRLLEGEHPGAGRGTCRWTGCSCARPPPTRRRCRLPVHERLGRSRPAATSTVARRPTDPWRRPGSRWSGPAGHGLRRRVHQRPAAELREPVGRCPAGDTVRGRCWPRSPGARSSPGTLTDAEVRVDDPALGTTLPGDLWLYATDGWLQWPGRLELTAPTPQAGITFRSPALPPARLLAGHRGRCPGDPVATVDGVPARGRPGRTVR